MKFIKQLSEDEFVVKMDLKDQDNSTRIVLAHDYLLISGRDWDCTDMQIKGSYGYANVVNHRVNIQIPIRMAQDILKNVLTSDREYLKEEHLIHSDGRPAYSDPDGTTYYYQKDDGTKMVAIYDLEQNSYIHLPETVINLVKENIKSR